MKLGINYLALNFEDTKWQKKCLWTSTSRRWTISFSTVGDAPLIQSGIPRPQINGATTGTRGWLHWWRHNCFCCRRNGSGGGSCGWFRGDRWWLSFCWSCDYYWSRCVWGERRLYLRERGRLGDDCDVSTSVEFLLRATAFATASVRSKTEIVAWNHKKRLANLLNF